MSKISDNKNKKPKILIKIKDISYYEKKLSKKNKDPIAQAYKKSSASPNKMFKNSMKELNRLLNKKN